MVNRKGLIHCLRFRHRKKDEHAFTITTCPGSRTTYTYIIVSQTTDD